MALIPVIVCVLFLDQYAMVVWAAAAGVMTTGVWLALTGFNGVQASAMLTAELIACGALWLTSSWFRSVRRLEVESEHQRNQALRLSETRRAHAERLAIVGRLASGVAHEINNPLAYVKANVNVLRRDLYGPDPLSEGEVKEVLDETNGGIERICQIVADLKTFAREGTDELEPVELKELVDGAVRLASVRLPTGLRPAVEIPAGVLVRANRRKLSQVLLNLLVNAGEAIEEARTKLPFVVLRTERTDDAIVLSIEDNGPGIPDELQARLFEPFFTTKGPGKGTGLGLALSREYLAGFGATIRAASVPGGGARFVVTLRVAEQPAQAGRLVA
jgi:C4-dicarboxylate-specific signal transduction histidine kinase